MSGLRIGGLFKDSVALARVSRSALALSSSRCLRTFAMASATWEPRHITVKPPWSLQMSGTLCVGLSVSCAVIYWGSY